MAAAAWDARGSNGAKAQFSGEKAPQVREPQIWMTSTKGYGRQITIFRVQFLRNLKCSKYDQSIHNKQLGLSLYD